MPPPPNQYENSPTAPSPQPHSISQRIYQKPHPVLVCIVTAPGMLSDCLPQVLGSIPLLQCLLSTGQSILKRALQWLSCLILVKNQMLMRWKMWNQHKFQPNYELYIYKVHISIILYSEWYMYIEKFDNKN